MTVSPARVDHDVVVIGDGPAGRAVGAQCHQRGIDTVVVGPAQSWTATYGTWVDELPNYVELLSSTSPIDVVCPIGEANGRHRLDRAYGVFDNRRLANSLDVAPHLIGRVTGVRHHTWGAAVHTAAGERLTTRLVIDATGASSLAGDGAATSFQTGYGLVLPDRPGVIGGDAAVLMDWTAPKANASEPTFLYVLDLGDGRWLVEETSLARRTPMDAAELRSRLASRLGHDHTDRAEHIEHVVIPMRPGAPDRFLSTVAFGAAAGYVHPATGYSIAASLRAAPRVAAAIADSDLDAPATASRRVWDAVWPAEQRRTRRLHDVGLAALLRLANDDVGEFFAILFELPSKVWAPYLRIDASPAQVRTAMTAVFSRGSWPIRRRLMAGGPVALARLLR